MFIYYYNPQRQYIQLSLLDHFFSGFTLCGLPHWLGGKESIYQAGNPGLTPWLGNSLGAGNDNPFQYSCLENCMDRGAWWYLVDEVEKVWTSLRH